MQKSSTFVANLKNLPFYGLAIASRRSRSTALPKYLDGFRLDASVPSDQEFLLFTLEGLNALAKHVGGPGAFSLAQAEWNCHSEVLDYGDLTYRPLLSPFDMNCTGALYHDPQVSPKLKCYVRHIWFL